MRKRNIPVVDLSKFVKGDAADREAFVRDLGHAFHEIGFVGVVNHGISKDLVSRFYSESKAFFGLSREVKYKYELDGLAGQRGFTSFGKEHAKQSDVADLKEFFQIGQEEEPFEGYASQTMDNVHIDESPKFTSTGMELYQAFQTSGTHLLHAIALYLNLDEHHFDRYIKGGNSILRSIHYPPITKEPESAIRAEQHEDINLITLLVGASAGGLQLLNMDNEWMDIVPEEDEIVINVGDMLQRMTNNYLKSTTHRVINPPREEWHKPRLSIPFFLHPVSEMDLTSLDSQITEDNPKAYSDMTAGEYLDERLREIGLKK